MADPFTMAMVASTALNAAGSIMGGNAEYSQGMYEANQATENARIARMNASSMRQAGAVAQEAKAREIRKSLGRSAAASSQAGVGGPSYGSNFALLKQASTEGKLDEMNVGHGYEADAYGSDVEALQFDAASTAAKRRARGARTAGFVGAASEALKGFSSYSGQRAQRSSGRPSSRPSSPRGGRVSIFGRSAGF